MEKWIGIPIEVNQSCWQNYSCFSKYLLKKVKEGKEEGIWWATTWCIWSKRNRIIFQWSVTCIPFLSNCNFYDFFVSPLDFLR